MDDEMMGYTVCLSVFCFYLFIYLQTNQPNF